MRRFRRDSAALEPACGTAQGICRVSKMGAALFDSSIGRISAKPFDGCRDPALHDISNCQQPVE
jgi:hypothetical protein